MKHLIPFFPFLFAILISCSGQQTSRPADKTAVSASVTLGDTVNELSRNIMVIYQDSKNNYWFGSWEDGLYRSDGKTILHFTTRHGLPHNRVDEIKEDKNGNLFINTLDGLCKYDGKQFIPIRETPGALSTWSLGPDDLWFKSPRYSGTVYRYDGAQLHLLKIPPVGPGEEWIKKQPNNQITPYGVYCIYPDSKGNVWFGTAVLGAMRYNGATFDWILEPDVTELHNGPSNGVRGIAEDREGYFWFNASYRYGVYPETNQANSGKPFYTRVPSVGSLDGIPGGNILEYLSIVKDNNGDMWIATYRDGIWQYDGKKITHHEVRVDNQQILLFYIYKDNAGTLWLGTHENGAWRFNGEEFVQFRTK